MVSPLARREQVAFVCQRGLSKRRACGLIGIARSSLCYELRMPVKDAPAMEAMRRLSSLYPRYGYRRIRIFLGREGHELGTGRAERIWHRAKLQLPRRRPRRRIASARPRPLPPRAANHVWAYDFLLDACASGQQIKCLTIVDEFTHECLAIDVAVELLKSYFDIEDRDDARRVREKTSGKLLTLDRAVEPHLVPLLALSDVAVDDESWHPLQPRVRRLDLTHPTPLAKGRLGRWLA